jgi:hypothetical protein
MNAVLELSCAEREVAATMKAASGEKFAASECEGEIMSVDAEGFAKRESEEGAINGVMVDFARSPPSLSMLRDHMAFAAVVNDMLYTYPFPLVVWYVDQVLRTRGNATRLSRVEEIRIGKLPRADMLLRVLLFSCIMIWQCCMLIPLSPHTRNRRTLRTRAGGSHGNDT